MTLEVWFQLAGNCNESNCKFFYHQVALFDIVECATDVVDWLLILLEKE